MTGTKAGWLFLIPLLPLLGALANALCGRRYGSKISGWIACATVGGSFVVSLVALQRLRSLPTGGFLQNPLWTWIESGAFRADLSLTVDPLGQIMVLIVSGVGLLIHIYSIGYMRGDQSIQRYFVYLNLFVFFMLLLVMADNLLVMFVGWEGVGLCSYLLIGFWFEKEENSDAGKKAFIVNRIGDFGFLLGLFLLSWSVVDHGGRSLDFADLVEKTAGLDPNLVTVIALLLFVGAVGKSAQIPLYVWLPDAMAGPTPVSALIHAATMVTAGVYMTVRLSFLYFASPAALSVVAVIGLLTSLLAASIAIVQSDIKKILAYSTVSQLGMMFLGVGVGAFSQATFHLLTHAFFKALLFLGAGSIIHALEGEQDVKNMGGLAKKMPLTMTTFLIASLAISGTPGFSGYYSKDALLWMAHASPLGSPTLWALGVLLAGLTAFYTFRLFFLVFFGKARGPIAVFTHAHESPWVMSAPLIVLAILSLIGGWWAKDFGSFLSTVVASPVLSPDAAETEEALTLVSIAVSMGGIILALLFYLLVPSIPERLAVSLRRGHGILYHKYYVDEVYGALILAPFQKASMWLWQAFDIRVIDRIVNGLGESVVLSSEGWRLAQTGNVQHYALGFLLGAVAILALILWVI